LCDTHSCTKAQPLATSQPIFWFFEGHAAKILFKALIDAFRLAIRFRVMGCRELQRNLQGRENFFPYDAGENRVSVADNY
jgi:hypothetical protein